MVAKKYFLTFITIVSLVTAVSGVSAATTERGSLTQLRDNDRGRMEMRRDVDFGRGFDRDLDRGRFFRDRDDFGRAFIGGDLDDLFLLRGLLNGPVVNPYVYPAYPLSGSFYYPCVW